MSEWGGASAGSDIRKALAKTYCTDFFFLVGLD